MIERITNTLDEISDGHEIRFTASMVQPFKRSLFDRASLGLGNRSGKYGEPHIEETFGVIHYVVLPEDW